MGTTLGRTPNGLIRSRRGSRIAAVWTRSTYFYLFDVVFWISRTFVPLIFCIVHFLCWKISRRWASILVVVTVDDWQPASFLRNGLSASRRNVNIFSTGESIMISDVNEEDNGGKQGWFCPKGLLIVVGVNSQWQLTFGGRRCWILRRLTWRIRRRRVTRDLGWHKGRHKWRYLAWNERWN